MKIYLPGAVISQNTLFQQLKFNRNESPLLTLFSVTFMAEAKKEPVADWFETCMRTRLVERSLKRDVQGILAFQKVKGYEAIDLTRDVEYAKRLVGFASKYRSADDTKQKVHMEFLDPSQKKAISEFREAQGWRFDEELASGLGVARSNDDDIWDKVSEENVQTQKKEKGSVNSGKRQVGRMDSRIPEGIKAIHKSNRQPQRAMSPGVTFN